ncbi:MAG: hypothetical protein FWD26_00605 [Treponema sp.]|nr:hypothetical protein [Treponema sp.]
MARLIILLFFLFSAVLLFATEELLNLMEDWFAVETAVNKSEKSFSAQEMLNALEIFQASLKNFTETLLFLQYEKIGLLREENGKAICLKTQQLIEYVKEGDTASVSKTINEIRKELAFWMRVDSKVESQVLSRYAYIFAFFICFAAILIAVIFYLYRALHRSRIHEQENAEFSRATLLAQEKERAFLSAELHDTVLQDMSRLLRMNDETEKQQTELTRLIMTRIREICRTLMPFDFSRLALPDALQQLCLDFNKRTRNKVSGAGTECRVIIAENFSAAFLTPQMQLQVYRIVQEALANIEKHARATEVTLTARNTDSNTLLVCISDDGLGCPHGLPGEKQEGWAGALGIRGMYQRAAILGATLTFIPGAGKGLTVRLEVPSSY